MSSFNPTGGNIKHFYLIINTHSDTQISSSVFSSYLFFLLLFEGENGILGPPGPAGAPGITVSVLWVS